MQQDGSNKIPLRNQALLLSSSINGPIMRLSGAIKSLLLPTTRIIIIKNNKTMKTIRWEKKKKERNNRLK